MIRAGCIGVVPLRKRRLVNPSEGHHRHLVGNQRWQQVHLRHRNRGELRKLHYRRIPPRIGTHARIGNASGIRLCRSRILSGGPLWLSRCPLLDRRRVGRVSDVGRKAWLMLGILVSVVRGLLGFRLGRSESHSVGIPFLLLCPSCSESSIAHIGWSSMIELPSFQAYFNPFNREY